MTGLSSTYLYRDMRELPDTNKDDDVRGDPAGHFVVLYGYDRNKRLVEVADPYRQNPLGQGLYYTVDMHRLIGAVLLGCLTYDANLLIIEKPSTMSNLIVVDDPADWARTGRCRGGGARTYLTDARFSNLRRARVYNLCESYRYQSTGYYVSLLAAARGHRPLPDVLTMQDIKNRRDAAPGG